VSSSFQFLKELAGVHETPYRTFNYKIPGKRNYDVEATLAACTFRSRHCVVIGLGIKGLFFRQYDCSMYNSKMTFNFMVVTKE
jgi:hypothetical protein